MIEGDYVKPQDFNFEFWHGIGKFAKLYHGTTEEGWQKIQRSGLKPKCKTRGIANRSTGCAVFTSSDLGTAEYYYDVVVEIDVAHMKADGHMPEVSQENPIAEAELERALAWAVGLEDYEVELESGLDEGTVIFYGEIPVKYLTRVK